MNIHQDCHSLQQLEELLEMRLIDESVENLQAFAAISGQSLCKITESNTLKNNNSHSKDKEDHCEGVQRYLADEKAKVRDESPAIDNQYHHLKHQGHDKAEYLRHNNKKTWQAL